MTDPDNAVPHARFRRCVIHCGTEKTGSSSIQHFLSSNRDVLAAEGVLYPTFTGSQGGSQWGFIAAVQDDVWRADIGHRLSLTDHEAVLAYRDALTAAIDAEAATVPQTDTLLVSCEHFHSRLCSPASILRLREYLQRWTDEFLVIVYFRRQDRAAISHYSTRLKSGNPSPGAFPSLTEGALPYYYDYQSVYANWAEVFGAGNLSPALYDPGSWVRGDLLEDFCSRAGLSSANKTRPRRQINRSVDERGARLLMELNRQWRRSPGRTLSREAVAALIAKKYPGRCYPATEQAARRFQAHFEDCNETLRQQAFPEREAPLFDNDFSDYPERLPDVTIDVQRTFADLLAESEKIADEPPEAPARGARVKRALASLSLRVRGHLLPTAAPPPLFLHVGLPKTATTTLQNTIFTQHPGIYFLGKSLSYDHPKRCRSAEIYRLLEPILWERKAIASRTRALRSALQAALGDLDGRALVGSWEGIGIQSPTQFRQTLANLTAVFPDIHIIFSLRNPFTRLPSGYLQALKACSKSGSHATLPRGCVYRDFDDWLHGRGVTMRHDRRFDFGDNVRHAVSTLGQGRVGVLLLEDLMRDPPGFFADVARLLGVDETIALNLENRLMNPALSEGEVACLAAMETGSPEDKAHWFAMSATERRQCLIDAESRGSKAKYRVILTDAQRAYIAERSVDVNRYIADTFELDLGAYGYPL